ncbi:MalY/PatB family protein [Acidobacteriota bacterium]
MNYDFDEILKRSGTNSMKWDSAERRVGVTDVLPMWVADMDFKSPKTVIDALRQRVNHGVYGYTEKPSSTYEAVISWQKKRFKWDVKREWIVFTPGVVMALCMAIQAYTRPGDKVIIQPPVYYPFFDIIQANNRVVLNNPLKIEENRYVMDLDHLVKAIDEKTKMMILCSPHNPAGRVWTKEELVQLSRICQEKGIILVSDEIHADLVMKGHTHIPAATLSEESADFIVTCNAPTKTFNLPGLEMAYAIIPDKKLRHLFKKPLTQTGLFLSNMFGIVALEAAYNQGEEWLEQLLDYLQGNYEFLLSFVKDNLHRVTVFPLEGTYLVWLDFQKYDLTDSVLRDLLLKEAKVWLGDGPRFGPGGEGFQRINIACPRETLRKGLAQIARALKRFD